jgi:hypothetical protein
MCVTRCRLSALAGRRRDRGWQAVGVATAPAPLMIDLDDFDAVGVASDALVALRVHAIEHGTDAAATVSAPDGWHRVVATARESGHLVLSVRYGELTLSRWNNVAAAIAKRGWDLDDDAEGATRRFPPGTEATTVAFELLASLTLSGAPAGTRSITAVDGNGDPVELRPT